MTSPVGKQDRKALEAVRKLSNDLEEQLAKRAQKIEDFQKQIQLETMAPARPFKGWGNTLPKAHSYAADVAILSRNRRAKAA